MHVPGFLFIIPVSCTSNFLYTVRYWRVIHFIYVWTHIVPNRKKKNQMTGLQRGVGLRSTISVLSTRRPDLSQFTQEHLCSAVAHNVRGQSHYASASASCQAFTLSCVYHCCISLIVCVAKSIYSNVYVES